MVRCTCATATDGEGLALEQQPSLWVFMCSYALDCVHKESGTKNPSVVCNFSRTLGP